MKPFAVAVVMTVLLAAGAAFASAADAPSAASSFAILKQPVDTSHDADLTAAFRGVSRLAEQPDGSVAAVAVVGVKVYVNYGSSFMSRGVIKARKGRLAFYSKTSGPKPRIRLVQLVPDGIDHVIVGKRRVAVHDNVVVVKVSEQQATRYMVRAATGRGKQAFGYRRP